MAPEEEATPSSDLEEPRGRLRRPERWKGARSGDEQDLEEVRDVDTEGSEGLPRNRTSELEERE